MKKFLKFLLIFIVIIVVGLLIAGMVMPNHVLINRSTLIKASKDDVFEQMVKFKNWPTWSPWLAMDTTTKLTYEGTDGTPGSLYTWDSKNGDVGMGTTINKAVNGTQMDFHIDFFRPFKNTAEGTIQAKDSAGMVKAIWTLDILCPFPFNSLQIFPFLSMEKMVGTAFEQGLEKMKAYVESHPSTVVPAIEISEVDYPAHVFQGMRKTVAWTDISKFYMENMEMLAKGIGDKISGTATGLYFTWDTVNKNTDMVAAFPVSDTTKIVAGSSIVHQDASKALMTVYKGPYSNMMNAHMALGKEVATKGKTQTLVIEEYTVGAYQEKDSTKWVTNIYYLVK